MRYPLPWFPLSDDPRRCILRTTTDCRPYRSSHAECHLVAAEVVGLLTASSSRLSEKQKPRACVALTLYVEIGVFIRATACKNQSYLP